MAQAVEITGASAGLAGRPRGCAASAPPADKLAGTAPEQLQHPAVVAPGLTVADPRVAVVVATVPGLPDWQRPVRHHQPPRPAEPQRELQVRVPVEARRGRQAARRQRPRPVRTASR